ncbi:MAG: flavodoxin domain-containing protein [Lachnospiraceae bacterium]|nr:flavodoxin domain-containing protein [Lachnospiraceae bacterium]
MSKVAIIYYSQTGNTEELAKEIAAGVRAAGGEADLMKPQDVKSIKNYDSVALGCPAMGFEEIDDDIFGPVYEAIRGDLPQKKVMLFGSYGWGGGEWMRTWEKEITASGVRLVCDSVICCEGPDRQVREEARAAGAQLV